MRFYIFLSQQQSQLSFERGIQLFIVFRKDLFVDYGRQKILLQWSIIYQRHSSTSQYFVQSYIVFTAKHFLILVVVYVLNNISKHVLILVTVNYGSTYLSKIVYIFLILLTLFSVTDATSLYIKLPIILRKTLVQISTASLSFFSMNYYIYLR